MCGTCDTVVVNLECCVSARGEPTGLIAGKPFFFRAPPIAVDALTAVGVGAVSLANNHALERACSELGTHVERLAEQRFSVTG